MFCTSCGNKLAEDAKFCSNCGAPVVKDEPQQPEPVYTEWSPEPQSEPAISPMEEQYSEPVPQPEPQPEPVYVGQNEPRYAQQYDPQPEPQWQQPYANSQWQAPEYSKPKSGSRAGLVIGICCGAAAILIVAITMLVFFMGKSSGAGSYSEAIDKYTDAILYGKGGKTVDLMYDDYVDYIISMGYFDSRSELKQSLQDDSKWDMMSFSEEYGRDYRVELIQTDVYRYDQIDLGYLNDSLVYDYGFGKRATEAVTVYFDVYITGSEGSDETSTYFEAMCVDGRWYMVPDEFGY